MSDQEQTISGARGCSPADEIPSPTGSCPGSGTSTSSTDSDSMDCSDHSSSSRRSRSYNLRRSSLVNRVESEKKRCQPREPKTKAKPPPLSKYRRKTANARERGRMQDINDAFEQLRRVIPELPGAQGKLTKITTLRLAMNYIDALSEMLRNDENDRAEAASSTSDLGSTGSNSDTCSSPGGSCSESSSPAISSLDLSDKMCLGSSGIDSDGDSLLFDPGTILPEVKPCSCT